MAKDDIIPILKPFQSTFRNEPFKALLFTLTLSEISVLVANFDVVTSKFIEVYRVANECDRGFSDCLRVLSDVLFICEFCLHSPNTST